MAGCAARGSVPLVHQHVPGEAAAQLDSVVPAAVDGLDRGIHRQALARLPDDPSEEAPFFGIITFALPGELADRSNRPGVGAFEDRAEEPSRLLLLRALDLRVEVQHGSRGGQRLADNQVDTKAGMGLSPGRNEDRALGGDAGPLLLLQHARAQHLLERKRSFLQLRGDFARVGVHGHHVPAVEHELEPRARAVVQGHLRSDQGSLAPHPRVRDGTHLELEQVRLRHVGVRAVKRTVGAGGPRGDADQGAHHGNDDAAASPSLGMRRLLEWRHRMCLVVDLSPNLLERGQLLRMKVTFMVTRYSRILPSEITTFWLLIHAPFTFSSVLFALAIPTSMASSKPFTDDDVISVTRATVDMAVLLVVRTRL